MDTQNAAIAGGFTDTPVEQMEYGGGAEGPLRHTAITAPQKRSFLCQPQTHRIFANIKV